MSRMVRLAVVWPLLLVACAPYWFPEQPETIVVCEEVEVPAVNQVFLPLVATNSLSCETLQNYVQVHYVYSDITEEYQVVDCLNVEYWPMTIEYTDIVEIRGQWGMINDLQVLVWGDGPFVINLVLGGE